MSSDTVPVPQPAVEKDPGVRRRHAAPGDRGELKPAKACPVRLFRIRECRPSPSPTRARACSIASGRCAAAPASEQVELEAAAGRVLAEEVRADRDYPALARSVRDGFAVRAVDLPGELAVIGEVRAGEKFAGEVGRDQAVEIMTGAPIPRGADAVVMVEHVTRDGDRVRIDRAAEPGQFINPQGCEAAAGETLLRPGKRLDYSDVALLAAAGRHQVDVYAQPKVAILATGDEIVPVTEEPADFQIRNSNAYSLAVQVARAGGIARDAGRGAR